MAGDEDRPSPEPQGPVEADDAAALAPHATPSLVDETPAATADAAWARPTETAAAPPPPARSPMQTVLAVIGVILILLLVANLYTLYNPPGNDALAAAVADTAALKQRVAAIEPAVGAVPALDQRVGGLAGQVDQLKGAVAKTGDGAAAATAAVAPLDAKVADLGSRLSALDSKVADLGKGLGAVIASVAALPKVDLAPLNGKVADLGKGLGAVTATVAALPRIDLAPLEGKVAALDKRIAPLETYFTAPKATEQVTQARQNGPAAETRAAPLAVVAQGILADIDAGRPFEPEVQALASLGVDEATLGALRPVAAKGAATRADLVAGFAGAQDAVVVAAAPVETGTMMDRIMANAQAIVKVNRTGAGPGDDAAAIASRITDDLKRGDLEAASAAWDTLPAASKARSADWADRLKARLKAEAAARTVETKAVAALAAVQ